MSCTPIENMVLVHNSQEKQCFERESVIIIIPPVLKVSTNAKMRNRYNQVPHLTKDTTSEKMRNRYNQVPNLTKDTTWESDKTQVNFTHKRAKRLALSQQVTTNYKSKYEGKDQKSVQSSTTPNQGHHMGK